MTEVSVVFPSSGSVDVQHRESVQVNQEVGWRVQSFNPDVIKVKIKFAQTIDKFFNLSHESPEKSLTYSDAPGHEFGTARIYGRAPNYGSAVNKEFKIAKYSVIGITAEADIVLDPEIVIHTEPTALEPTSKLSP